jgi:hypothetical protein
LFSFIPVAQEIRRRRRAPHVGDLLGVPDLGPLRAIVVPGPRIEIAELVVLHLVELGVELDHPVVVVAVEGGEVVPGAKTHRPPDDRNLPLAEKIARRLQVGEIFQLVGDVMHLDILAGDEIYRMMVGVAAHEDEEIADPVGDTETENLAVELDH